jgi:hypothetical protein
MAKRKAKKATSSVPKRVTKEIPMAVKIISVLSYILAVIYLVAGIFFIAGAGTLSSLQEVPVIAMLGTAGFAFLGLILIALAVLAFFVGRGLWKGKNWARIVAIIISILGVISAIASLIGGSSIISNLITLIVYALIGGYLLFSKKVKASFK